MIKQTIIPSGNSIVLQIPDNLVGKEVAIIAFATDEGSYYKIQTETVPKRTIGDAINFYNNNAVDFSKIEKWKRDDLYE